MQKQIRQDGANDPSLRSSRHSGHDVAIFQLARSLQPALDIEQHPRLVCMTTDRPKHQLPIDGGEIGFYVEIEHPVVAPTTLTSLAHGIDRRFAGPVAIGVGVERRLQTRLKVATDNFLGDPVVSAEQRSPFGPAPLQSLHPRYELLSPYAP